MTRDRSHQEQFRLYAIATKHRRVIREILDGCSDYFLCPDCREKLNHHVNALLHLPDTILEELSNLLEDRK